MEVVIDVHGVTVNGRAFKTLAAARDYLDSIDNCKAAHERERSVSRGLFRRQQLNAESLYRESAGIRGPLYHADDSAA
jgi:hypothetical protein